MLLNTLVYVAILPFAVATIASLIARRWRMPPGCDWAIAVALGFVAGQLGLWSSESLSALGQLVAPLEAVHWLPHAVLIAGGIALLSTGDRPSFRAASLTLAGALAIGLPLRLLANSAYTLRWTTAEKLAFIALLSATIALTWLVLGTAGQREHSRLRPLLLIVVAAGAAVVIALSGVFAYGQLCGVVAAAISGATVSAVADDTHFPRIRIPFVPLRTAPSPWRVASAAGVITCSLGGLIVLAGFYGELSPLNATLLFLSLLAAGGRLPRFVAALPARSRGAVRIAFCLLPLAIALARSITAAQASMSNGPYAGL
jgi:hypothetical protein